MKKYLMSGVAAIAFLAALTSCSKSTDLYDQGAVDEKNKQEQQQKTQDAIDQAKVNYAKAFESAFGKVDSKVDWGFSSKKANTRAFTRAKGDYDGYYGDLTPVGVNFPGDCAASNFDPDLDGVKSYKEVADAANQGGGFATGICYIDENHTGKIHIWGGSTRAKLYFMAGTYDFTNETFIVEANADVYLLSGATVTLNNDAANTAKFDIYIASGAKLIANGENGYRADVDAHVYNHGTIECTRFEVNGTSSLYNVGILKVPAGDVYIANSTSRIVNDGSINAASTHVEGSGALQNNAEWTVTGNTVVNCDKGGWVNNGHWKTQNYYYTAGSSNVINNCFLEVTEDFNINMSSATSENGFKIDSNGGVKTKNFYGGKDSDKANSKSGPYKVIMGQKSVFKVTGTATLEGGNKGWGFFGPSSGEYAVFQAKDIVRNPELAGTQGAVTYSGNLYVSAETHFAPGNDGQDSDGHYFISELGGFSVNNNIYAAGFNPGTPNITIQETPCNPGFDGSEPLYRVIAEDLNAGAPSDFDFNDVVFDIVKAEGGKTTLRLQCAGGIYPLKITENENFEIHKLFGCSKSDVIVNTGRISGFDYIEHAPVEFDIDGTFTTPEQIKNIKIYVQRVGEEWTELEAKQGEAACKILVDSKFTILGEKTDIKTVYTKFPDYVQGTIGNDEFQWWYKQSK